MLTSPTLKGTEFYAPNDKFIFKDRVYKKGRVHIPKIIKDDDYNVNPKRFINEIDEYSAYVLGLLWADGYLKINSSSIAIECLASDMNEFKSWFNLTGKWSETNRHRLGKKPQTILYTANKKLYEFLSDNDYKEKSNKSPDKIFSLIPLEFSSYFILGVIDGDGCFYFNNKNNCRQFSITGSLNQDWSLFERLFNELNITYKVRRIINKTNVGYSQIRIINKRHIQILGEFVYRNITNDNIGLKRKYFKYIAMMEGM